MPFDLERVRADFPILDEKIFGNRLVYLDSGASEPQTAEILMRRGAGNCLEDAQEVKRT